MQASGKEEGGVCGSDRLFPALGGRPSSYFRAGQRRSSTKILSRGFDTWKSLLGKGGYKGKREENMWTRPFLQETFSSLPPGFMSSACSVPFAPEQADNLLRGRAAALRADDERREGDDGRGHDGVDAAHAGLEDAEDEEAGDARHDGGDRAGGVGFLPVEAEDDRPEEDGFKPAEREEVDPDQQIRRFDGGGENDESDDGGTDGSWFAGVRASCATRRLSARNGCTDPR